MKKILNTFIIFIAFAFLLQEAKAALKMAVFYGSTIPLKQREKILKDKLPGVEITIYARSKDFFDAIENGGASLAIAPSSLEVVRKDFEPNLQFTIMGKSDFSYKWIGQDKALASSALNSVTFGALEEIDRQELKNYLKDKVGVTSSKIKTVPKLEDLFPLLVFKAADIVIVPPHNYDDLKKIFNAETHEIKAKGQPIKYPRFYSKKGEDAANVIKMLEGLGQKDLKVLGFDGLEKVKL